jgi:hypothetical protein
VARRRPAINYGSTRLLDVDQLSWEPVAGQDQLTTVLVQGVNFQIPLDLQDRHKQLAREVERMRLRHPNLTELLIGLLGQGTDTPDDVAAMVRRKRASERRMDYHA